MLFRETVAVYCQNHTEHTDTLCGQNVEKFSVFKRLVRILITGVNKVTMHLSLSILHTKSVDINAIKSHIEPKYISHVLLFSFKAINAVNKKSVLFWHAVLCNAEESY
jgi:hypothetical protein